MGQPQLLAMLSKQGIEGDDALLRLGQVRLGEAGLGAELYPETPRQLEHQLAFRPAGHPCTAHLPRYLNVLQREARDRVLEFARVGAGQLYGVLVHDHAEFQAAPAKVVAALRDLEREVAAIRNAPRVFVEYAAGLPLDVFASLFESIGDVERVTACIDISHVGIELSRLHFVQACPGMNVFALKTSPELPRWLEQVQAAVAQALPGVVELIRRLVAIGKPLHFHLHDGHPLSTLSRYGVSDHLSFVQQILVPTPGGRRLTPGIFGPAGLREVVRTALAGPADQLISLMLEVHPQEGLTPLGPHREILRHWGDVTNAERMNFWLEMLLQNSVLLRDACHAARPSPER